MEWVFVLILAHGLYLHIRRETRVVVGRSLGRYSPQQFASAAEEKESHCCPGRMNIVFGEGRQHRRHRSAHPEQVLTILRHRLEVANPPVQFEIQGDDESAWSLRLCADRQVKLPPASVQLEAVAWQSSSDGRTR